MTWQAEAGLWYRMPGGYFIGPQRDSDQPRFDAVPSPASMTLGRIYAGYPPPRLTGPRRRALASDFIRWRIGSVVVGPMPNQAVMVGFLTDLLGRQPRCSRASTCGATRWSSSGTGVRTGVRATGGPHGVPGRDRLLEHLGDVQDPDALAVALGLALLDGVVQHDHAVGAGRPDHVGASGQGLVGALEVDPLADPLLHPHAGPAGAAAEARAPAPVHLDRADPGDGVQHRPGAS